MGRRCSRRDDEMSDIDFIMLVIGLVMYALGLAHLIVHYRIGIADRIWGIMGIILGAAAIARSIAPYYG
jgi:hypothetical protein